MTTLLYTHDACLTHDPGSFHPECPDRLRAIFHALAGPAFAGLQRREAPRGGFLIAGGAWSDLDSGARDWGEVNLSGEAPVSRALSVGGRASWYRRFGLEDVELEGRIAARPSEKKSSPPKRSHEK